MMVDIGGLMERASLLLQQHRYKEAEEMIRKVLEQEPGNDHALSLLGRCYINNNRVQEGKELIREAISLNPNNSFYFYLLGFANYHLNKPADAINDLNKAISIFPYEPEYFGLLAFVEIEQKKFSQGLDHANTGLGIDAQNITCLNARATALNKLKRTDESIDTMQHALSHDPENELTHVTAGWNLLEKGRHREAEKHFMEALRLRPDYSSAQKGLKESLKARIPPYKWMLQYSFWVQNKSRGVQRIMPIIIYVVFRLLIAAFNSSEKSTLIAYGLIGLYILLLITSWTINSLANFFLLFHPTGKHALTHSEKWSAISVVLAMTAGISAMAVSASTSIAAGTRYELLFVAGMVCLSLALPLGRISFPLTIRGNKEWMLTALLALGAAGLLCFIFVPAVALTLFMIYGICFIIYTWIGAFR